MSGGILFALLITETEQSYTSTVVAAMFANDVDVNYVTIIAAGCCRDPRDFCSFFQKYIISGLLSGLSKLKQPSSKYPQASHQSYVQ